MEKQPAPCYNRFMQAVYCGRLFPKDRRVKNAASADGACRRQTQRTSHGIIDCNGKTVAISEEQLKTDTPMMYNYLFQKKEELGKRDYFNKSSKLWYELWNPRKKEHFLAKKFVFAEINMFNLNYS